MSDWIRVTIACPEAKIADANQLASVLGFSAADVGTFGEPVWQDAAGNRYAVASTLAKPTFVTDAVSALVDPPWGADMAAASRAQALISIGGAADPSRLVAVFGEDAGVAFDALGVSPVIGA
jgi:hypothetical protein